MSFLINKNSILDKLTLFQQVYPIFVFVLDFIGGCVVEDIDVFNDDYELEDHLGVVFVGGFWVLVPLDLEPVSLLPSTVLFLYWRNLAEFAFFILLHITFFQPFATFPSKLALIEHRLNIPINIPNNNLNSRWFLCFRIFDQLLNFYQILIFLWPLHKWTLANIW